MTDSCTAWKATHDDTLTTTIQRTPDNKDDTVDVTLIHVPPPLSSKKHKEVAGLSKVTPPGVGFVWFVRDKNDVLLTLTKEKAAKMFKKVRPNLMSNVETVEHEELGTIEVPVIPTSVWNVRLEGKKVKEDTTEYWNAVGTSRHSTPMNSHSQHPARKDLKKLRSRSLHKAWCEFKQSQYCTSIQLNESAYQIFSQTCTRLERKKWDAQAAERKRKNIENGGDGSEEVAAVVPAVVEEPKRKKRRR